jgi:RNA polymerase sigma-70 factor (ECF subfamily)
MQDSEADRGAAGDGPRQFATTHWSVVVRASDSQAPGSADALERLCRAYWYPLYVFVRTSGHGPEEARDLTQEFFARLLEKKWLAEADRERGRFRTFMIVALKRFMTNEWHRGRAIKRGGGQELLSLEALQAEEQFALEPLDAATPEALYERHWALTLIGRAQDRLRDEMVADGEGERFEALEPTLVGERTEGGYQALAERFGIAEGGVKSMVLRLRGRFRALLHDEVAQTLDEGEDVQAELKELLAVLRGK